MLVQSFGMIVVHLMLLKACVEAENADLVPMLDSNKESIFDVKQAYQLRTFGNGVSFEAT